MQPKEDPIIVVGAGIFGLSTSIHLAEQGYTNITVFDKQPYEVSQYSYFKGADAASADLNKIIRSAYGGESIYQDLTLEAIESWKSWNAELALGVDLPPGLKKHDRVFIPHGNLIMTDKGELSPFDRASVASMEANGLHQSQLVMSDSEQRAIARARGFGYAIDPFHRDKKGKLTSAILDTTGGTAIAEKACRFAMHKAKTLGVKFVLHPSSGCLKGLVSETSASGCRTVSGIATADGTTHLATTIIIACGGWTPSLLPDLDGICETTLGSVAFIKIPRQSALWDRLHEDCFPSWQWNMREGAEGGLYGFPRDENGWLKIGYRGTKYTNPTIQSDGKERSVPVTRWSGAGEGCGVEQLVSIPQHALTTMNKFLDEYLPELRESGIGISMTRACWYNDSYDNHLLIDHVPGSEGLMVATAGSGHAFKYLPIIGRYVVDVMEGVGLERPSLKAWKWRQLGTGDSSYNILMEGSKGSRALNNVEMAAAVENGMEKDVMSNTASISSPASC